jgi:LacI family transcriptional regulator
MPSAAPITLKLLAQELGLNISTVSRVLNDPAGLQSKWAAPQTTERILALARGRRRAASAGLCPGHHL